MAAHDQIRLGVCFDRSHPAPFVREMARSVESAGADELWVIEDCFFTAGISLAATALAVTEELHVGFGILPAVARNAAVTAMELATLCELAPGRVLGGVGHGVQSWMGQIGERTPSPLTTLDEVISVVKRLLAGERVTFDGQHVTLDDVVLEVPPPIPPPVLAGVQGPKSMELAGRVADGVVLAELTGPTVVRSNLELAGRVGDPTFETVVFSPCRIENDRAVARTAAAPMIVGLLREPSPQLRGAPFFDDLAARADRGGVDAVATMPDSWWTELCAVGDPDDVAAHVEALAAAGATSVALFPPNDVATTRDQISRWTTTILNR